MNKGIVIAGPTAVGKTDISIKIAKELDIEIISADSMQIYKEMNIGTSKISKKDMNGIVHHLLDIIEPIDYYSVSNYADDVNELLDGKNILLVGGTGLYISSITEGLSVLPQPDISIRKELENLSLEELQKILKEIDIVTYNAIDLKNKVRLIRAIEVVKLTGASFYKQKRQNIKNNDYNFLKIFLTRDRQELYNRINYRVDQMLEEGLLEEAYNIYKKYYDDRNKILAIGYKELFSYFDNNITLEEAIIKLKMETRRYAKRQLTWFNNKEEYIKYNLSEMSEEEVLEDILKRYRKEY